jgi:hypothetical protein
MPQAPPAEAGPDRSRQWKRSTPSLARSAKAVPCPSFPASAGRVPRSPAPGRRNCPRDPRESLSAPFRNPRESAGLKSTVLPDPCRRFLPRGAPALYRFRPNGAAHTSPGLQPWVDDRCIGGVLKERRIPGAPIDTSGGCGVPSERLGCLSANPGFHPGLVCGAPFGALQTDALAPRTSNPSSCPCPTRLLPGLSNVPESTKRCRFETQGHAGSSVPFSSRRSASVSCFLLRMLNTSG